MTDSELHHNKPVATLMRQFINKEKGKLTAARKELQYRFNYLDWSQQKKFLKLCLESCTTDRIWAYKKLYRYWDKSFLPIVKDLWERLHERECIWLVIKYFPEEYVASNIEELWGGRNYFFICLRLGVNSDFEIDRSELSANDCLYVYRTLGRSLTDEEAMDLVYTIARECAGLIMPDIHDMYIPSFIGSYMPSFIDIYMPHLIDIYQKHGRIDSTSPTIFMKLYKAEYCLSKMNCGNSMQMFADWKQRVAAEVLISEEYKELQHSNFNDSYYNKQVCDLVLKAIIANLPESSDRENHETEIDRDIEKDLERETIKEILLENENVRTLVEKLELY